MELFNRVVGSIRDIESPLIEWGGHKLPTSDSSESISYFCDIGVRTCQYRLLRDR